MGWLFSSKWPTKASLVKHLTTGNGVKTLRHCCVGTNLWCVHEGLTRTGVIKFICLYKMAKHGQGLDGWGYKDIDETMGPCEISCPVSYLTMCTAPEGHWAYAWRQLVYERAARSRKLVKGSKWYHAERDRVYEILKRTSPSSFYIRNVEGAVFKASLNTMLSMEEQP